MSVFALADLHLSFGSDKPMSVFGPAWDNHAAAIEANWRADVAASDTVIVAGDVSWGLRFADALPDFRFLDRLPGRKILVRGNHDYWWSTVGKMERLLAAAGLDSISFLRYEAHALAPGVWLAGSRGWLSESESGDWTTDGPIYRRELIRFEMAFDDVAGKRRDGDCLIAVSHYPPLDRTGAATPLSDLIRAAGADLCLHGHVHGTGRRSQVAGGLTYLNTAADVLAFRPLRLHDGRRLVYNEQTHT